MGRAVWFAVRTRVRVGIVEIEELGLSSSYFVVDWLVVCDDTEKLLITYLCRLVERLYARLIT